MSEPDRDTLIAENKRLKEENASLQTELNYALAELDKMAKRVGSTSATQHKGLAWFQVLDAGGDGHVTLDELLSGFNATDLLVAARQGLRLDRARFDGALTAVNYLLEELPDFVPGYRLKLILAAISDRYNDLFDACEGILRLTPNDGQALLLKALYSRSLGHCQDYDACLANLQEHEQEVARLLLQLVQKVEYYWDNELVSHLDSGDYAQGQGGFCILALGSPADDKGTPRPRLLGTLNATLEASNAFPDAPIYVTGGAVSSKMPEAIAMERWLVKNGVDEKRIVKEMVAKDTVGNYKEIAPLLRNGNIKNVVLITVDYHLRRSSILADSVFSDLQLPVKVVPLSAKGDMEGEVLERRLEVEKVASYRDLARAMHLYEQEDFEAHCKGLCLLKWRR